MSVKLFKSLLIKSSFIQKEIENEQKLKAPNYYRLARLKKIRLKIKDRILVLTRHPSIHRRLHSIISKNKTHA